MPDLIPGRSTWRFLMVGSAVGLLMTAGALLDPLNLLEVTELKALNAQFRLRGPAVPSSSIVIITIDEDSFDELNLAWPWPRAVHARLLDIVSQAKPSVIGLDIVFAEPSPYGPEDDEALARAVARAGNVVLGAALTSVRQGGFVKEALNPPIRPVRDGARAFGFVNFDADVDAFVRRNRLTHVFQGSALPGFDLHVYRVAAAAGLAASPLPTTEHLINYRGGPQTFQSLPYHRALADQVPRNAFAGKIVLVGASSPVLHDVFPTPFAPRGNMPGVEIHANALETLLQGEAIRPVPTTVNALLAVLGGALSLWIAITFRPTFALALVGGGLVLFLVGTHLAFLSGRWLAALPVSLTLMMTYVGAVGRNFMRERRQRQRLSRYFSPSVVEDIIQPRDDVSLNAAQRWMTVLFSDIRGFTSLSERMPPEEVVQLLREYLTEMTNVVFKHGGTVDKYIGDAIMALYNVPFPTPDHAARAVRTALELQARLRSLGERFVDKYGIRLECGVGINTGAAIVGTVGSEQRLEYTAIGDTINVGARLESLTKDLGATILISEATYLEVKDLFVTQDLGEQRIKGKDVPVRVYSVSGHTTRAEQPASP
jgi:adenylate cyclase